MEFLAATGGDLPLPFDLPDCFISLALKKNPLLRMTCNLTVARRLEK